MLTDRHVPLFLIFITLAQLGFFIYYSVINPADLDSVIIFRSDKRKEIWRYLSYMMLHSSWLHLGFNLVIQLLVGSPLEMRHGSFQVALIYISGVFARSLGYSVFETTFYLLGASGGVYALLAAYLADILLNYNNMQFGILKLIGIITIAFWQGYEIFSSYAGMLGGTPVSYVAHLAGLTIGLSVLNAEQIPYRQLLKGVAVGVYATCTISAIVFNFIRDS